MTFAVYAMISLLYVVITNANVNVTLSIVINFGLALKMK